MHSRIEIGIILRLIIIFNLVNIINFNLSFTTSIWESAIINIQHDFLWV